MLESLGGKWVDLEENKKVFRLDGGVLSWFPTTGTLFVQGHGVGVNKIYNNVPELLYPNEYKEIKSNSIITDIDVIKDNSEQDVEHLFLKNGFKNTEIILGIVNAVGTESRLVLTPLSERLKGFGYNVHEISVSTLISGSTRYDSEYKRIKDCMIKGDEIREKSCNNAMLAAGVSYQIQHLRNGVVNKNAYIVYSLKHPDEVEFLRKIYADGFYLIGVHADEVRRQKYLVNDKGLSHAQANELIRIDEDENISHGQRTRDTFHMADFFISLGESHDKVKNTLQRFLELIFSNPYKNPTFDEFAMFMAFNASIRSSDLSRQVGAIIARNCQIIATGANDCPKYGGGQYWAEMDQHTGEVRDAPDGKDYTREQDSNKVVQNEIITEICDSLVSSLGLDGSKISDIDEVLRKSKLSDLTEFGRVVHAEMEAILSCAREGILTKNSTLYCTTFPCHNCAKHIIDSGIVRVVYVEPYPKSRALDFHSESIELKTDADRPQSDKRVVFEPFIGVGARRFLDLFSMSLGSGMKLRRKDKQGNTIEWKKEEADVRTPLLPKSYLEIEKVAAELWSKISTKR
ncbi:MAG: dCMP deaminase family protein [Chlorobiaceae bacterium]|nr:dCMP deaminase family protein [Chlorobiaceae bacterium]NTV59864.1 dCMP deaminase family protein [Chlorobiaceae bacterium]